MRIKLEKFGQILTSRQAGREASAAFKPTLRELAAAESLEVDFDGILALSPSWADEFLSPLLATLHDRVALMASSNPSVRATIELLEATGGSNYRWVAA